MFIDKWFFILDRFDEETSPDLESFLQIIIARILKV